MGSLNSTENFLDFLNFIFAFVQLLKATTAEKKSELLERFMSEENLFRQMCLHVESGELTQ